MRGGSERKTDPVSNLRSATSLGRRSVDHVGGIIMGLALLRVSFLPG